MGAQSRRRRARRDLDSCLMVALVIGLLWNSSLVVGLTQVSNPIDGRVSISGDAPAQGNPAAISPRATDLASNAWVEPSPFPPISGYGVPMVYDAESDRAIAVGGETWIYNLNTNTWTNSTRSPIQTPIAMAYDSQSDRTIVFASGWLCPPCSWSQETWAFDVNTGAWSKRSPSTKLPDGFGGSMVYDSESDRVILIGSYPLPPSPPIGEFSGMMIWAYDYDADTWTNITNSTGEPAVPIGAVAYDSKSDRIVTFGESSDLWSTQTWTYDDNTNTWTNMSPASAPYGRFRSGIAYDSESDRVILFGGYARCPGCAESNETWAYDYAANTWTNMTSVVAPAGRLDAAMAYDSESDRIILFDSFNQQELDTWAYDYNTNTWTAEILLPPRSSLMTYDSKADRVLAVWNGVTWAYNPKSDVWEIRRSSASFWGGMGGLAYDSESNRSILFDVQYDHATTWAYGYDTNAWTNMTTASGPPLLYEPAMVYDVRSDRVVLSGSTLSDGWRGTPTVLTETWTYDYNSNTWSNMTSTVAPPGRVGASMAYDSLSDRTILFGGGTGVSYCDFGPLGDTWAYDYKTNTWTNMSPSAGPSARVNHAMTYASGADRVLLFGGGLTCVPSEFGGNETWTYDFDTNTWTNLSLAASPSARTYHRMVFDAASHFAVLYGGWPGTPGPWLLSFSPSPSSPKNLQAAPGNRQVTLTWEAPVLDGGTPITGYRIYRFTWPSGLSIVASVGPVFSYTDAGLTNGVLYYYWVSAMNALAEGALSNTAAATPRLMVSAPSDLQATADNGRVSLTWRAATSDVSSPVSGYRIYRGTSATPMSVLVPLCRTLGYTDANVTNGMTYFYRVSAMSGPDEGPRSNEAVAMPREGIKPSLAILSPADESSIAESSVVVSGTASDDTAILKVELSRDGRNWVQANGTTSWSGTLRLVEGANTIYARATDTSGNSATVVVSVTVVAPFSVADLLSSPVVVGACLAGAVIAVGAYLIRMRRSRL